MPAIIEPEPPPEPGAPARPLARRLLWFAALSLSGLGLTAGVAYALRALLLSA